jgi:hypothetical protein
VDVFPLIMLAVIGVVILAVVLIARIYPGSGADLLDWRPTRSYEHEVELELQDVQQMIDAQNEYRRRRGLPAVTEDDVRESVIRDEQERLEEEKRREPPVHG